MFYSIPADSANAANFLKKFINYLDSLAGKSGRSAGEEIGRSINICETEECREQIENLIEASIQEEEPSSDMKEDSELSTIIIAQTSKPAKKHRKPSSDMKQDSELSTIIIAQTSRPAKKHHKHARRIAEAPTYTLTFSAKNTNREKKYSKPPEHTEEVTDIEMAITEPSTAVKRIQKAPVNTEETPGFSIAISGKQSKIVTKKPIIEDDDDDYDESVSIPEKSYKLAIKHQVAEDDNDDSSTFILEKSSKPGKQQIPEEDDDDYSIIIPEQLVKLAKKHRITTTGQDISLILSEKTFMTEKPMKLSTTIPSTSLRATIITIKLSLEDVLQARQPVKEKPRLYTEVKSRRLHHPVSTLFELRLANVKTSSPRIQVEDFKDARPPKLPVSTVKFKLSKRIASYGKRAQQSNLLANRAYAYVSRTGMRYLPSKKKALYARPTILKNRKLPLAPKKTALFANPSDEEIKKQPLALEKIPLHAKPLVSEFVKEPLEKTPLHANPLVAKFIKEQNQEEARPADASISKANMRSMLIQENECQGVVKTKLGEVKKDDLLIFLSTALILTIAVFMCFCIALYIYSSRKKTKWNTDIVKEYSSRPEKDLQTANLFPNISLHPNKDIVPDKNVLLDKNLLPDKNILIEKNMNLETDLFLHKTVESDTEIPFYDRQPTGISKPAEDGMPARYATQARSMLPSGYITPPGSRIPTGYITPPGSLRTGEYITPPGGRMNSGNDTPPGSFMTSGNDTSPESLKASGNVTPPGSRMPAKHTSPPRSSMSTGSSSGHGNSSSPENTTSFKKNMFPDKFEKNMFPEKFMPTEKGRFSDKRVVAQSNTTMREIKPNILRPPSRSAVPGSDSHSPILPSGKRSVIYEETSSSISDSSAYTAGAHKASSPYQQPSQLQSPMSSGSFTSLGDTEKCQSPDCPDCTCSATRTYRNQRDMSAHFEEKDKVSPFPSIYKYRGASSKLPSGSAIPTLSSRSFSKSDTKASTHSTYPPSEYPEGNTKFPSLFRQ
ncbi:uncharacterized protein [Ambystoma mexicanum]|uniref:uncharacterized protein n=1 Tax=Ambystoma mexicanum TaxID=8296 RepID=UPI0037E787BE